eukprot:jgi/Tetstr1/422212/TSEL_013064.t1
MRAHNLTALLLVALLATSPAFVSGNSFIEAFSRAVFAAANDAPAPATSSVARSGPHGVLSVASQTSPAPVRLSCPLALDSCVVPLTNTTLPLENWELRSGRSFTSSDPLSSCCLCSVALQCFESDGSLTTAPAASEDDLRLYDSWCSALATHFDELFESGSPSGKPAYCSFETRESRVSADNEDDAEQFYGLDLAPTLPDVTDRTVEVEVESEADAEADSAAANSEDDASPASQADVDDVPSDSQDEGVGVASEDDDDEPSDSDGGDDESAESDRDDNASSEDDNGVSSDDDGDDVSSDDDGDDVSSDDDGDDVFSDDDGDDDASSEDDSNDDVSSENDDDVSASGSQDDENDDVTSESEDESQYHTCA